MPQIILHLTVETINHLSQLAVDKQTTLENTIKNLFPHQLEPRPRKNIVKTTFKRGRDHSVILYSPPRRSTAHETLTLLQKGAKENYCEPMLRLPLDKYRHKGSEVCDDQSILNAFNDEAVEYIVDICNEGQTSNPSYRITFNELTVIKPEAVK